MNKFYTIVFLLLVGFSSLYSADACNTFGVAIRVRAGKAGLGQHELAEYIGLMRTYFNSTQDRTKLSILEARLGPHNIVASAEGAKLPLSETGLKILDQ